MQLPPYMMLDKQVGQTPLVCVEDWRQNFDVDKEIPLTYAGRLDPMASGKLLVLIGEECKNQTNYHNLDKEYDFSVLLGISSDTQDVLGRLSTEATPSRATRADLRTVVSDLVGTVELPYPHFSAKTVQGKPLHTWTLEDRLDEIEIPTKKSTIYRLELTNIETKNREDLAAQARAKIDTIPEVSDIRKSIGNDFRRADVRSDWHKILADKSLPAIYQITHFTCVASSGTYMRTLAHLIGQKLGTQGLAWSIHRTKVGVYDQTHQRWTREF